MTLEQKVREILYVDWNPCGLSDLPYNEYDSYVPWVVDLVLKRDKNISIFLALLQDHYFNGIGKGEADLKQIAKSLLGLNP
jgi:hypothetical protein